MAWLIDRRAEDVLHSLRHLVQLTLKRESKSVLHKWAKVGAPPGGYIASTLQIARAYICRVAIYNEGYI